LSAPTRLVLLPPSDAQCERVCAVCRRKLGGKRLDAITCSKACRQKRARAMRREVSCEATTARRKDVPILSAAARARAGFSTSVPTREKRVVLVGKVHGREVSID
jgi:hypothetical protein